MNEESFFKGFLTAIELGRHFVMGLISKFITRNGTYIAANDGADGYSTVTVDVTPEFTAADEGKVVENGALAAQTSLAVTQNGTYDTTTNNEVVVNVSGGSTSVILSGTTDPTADVGNDGNIYLKHDAIPTLPAGLTAISYIESTGTQYINTGYLIKPNTKIEISMQIKNVQPNTNAVLFGARAYGYGTAGSPDAWAVGNRYVFGVQMGAVYKDYGSVYDYNTDIVFTAQSGIAGAWTGNGINKSYTINSSLGTGVYPLHLFTCYDHAYGHIGDMCSCLRLYYVKFYEGEELVRVYIPVSDSNGIPCLWETLSGQIYRNGGTGDFSAGTELRGTITAAYAKVNGVWQPLIGTNISDVTH